MFQEWHEVRRKKPSSLKQVLVTKWETRDKTDLTKCMFRRLFWHVYTIQLLKIPTVYGLPKSIIAFKCAALSNHESI
jgi:hypothetical protein